MNEDIKNTHTHKNPPLVFTLKASPFLREQSKNKIKTVFTIPCGELTYILNDKAHLTGAPREVSIKLPIMLA